MDILIVAFRYRHKRNISQETALRLAYPSVVLLKSDEIDSLVLRIRRMRPKFILGMGQSKRGRLIRIERAAKNILIVQGKTIVSGNEKLKSTLPIRKLAGTRICYDAGTHLCNYVYYRLLKEFHDSPRISFLHIPKSLPVPNSVKAVRRLISSFHNKQFK
jgi:pyrrolidone-carboxylate peptidase